MRGVLVIIVATAMASDDWKTLWWLPSDGDVTPGKQVASHKTMPHLMFIPAGTPPTDGWPLLVFLHGQGESSPTPLPRVAIQGPPFGVGEVLVVDLVVVEEQRERVDPAVDDVPAPDRDRVVGHRAVARERAPHRARAAPELGPAAQQQEEAREEDRLQPSGWEDLSSPALPLPAAVDEVVSASIGVASAPPDSDAPERAMLYDELAAGLASLHEETLATDG